MNIFFVNKHLTESVVNNVRLWPPLYRRKPTTPSKFLPIKQKLQINEKHILKGKLLLHSTIAIHFTYSILLF